MVVKLSTGKKPGQSTSMKSKSRDVYRLPDVNGKKDTREGNIMDSLYCAKASSRRKDRGGGTEGTNARARTVQKVVTKKGTASSYSKRDRQQDRQREMQNPRKEGSSKIAGVKRRLGGHLSKGKKDTPTTKGERCWSRGHER